MKLSKKLMILSLFLIMVCCLGSVSATEEVSDNVDISDDVDIEPSNDDGINEEILSSNELNDDVLTDNSNHDVIYVNSSSSASYKNVDGQSWDQAYGQGDGLYRAIENERLSENGKIYLATGEYNSNNGYNLNLYNIEKNNISIIGQDRDNTIIKGVATLGTGTSVDVNEDTYEWYYCHYKVNFVNLTFEDCTLNIENDKEFINCTFINSKIIFCHELNQNMFDEVKNSLDCSLISTFNNCNFKDYLGEKSYITSYPYGQVNIFNCTFENITADSVVYSGIIIEDNRVYPSTNGAFEDGIHISNSTFIDVNVTGVMDVEEQYGTFKNNTGDVNAFRAAPADSNLTIEAVKTDSSIVFMFILKDSEGNPIKDAIIRVTTTSDPNFIKYYHTDENGICEHTHNGDWNIWEGDYMGEHSRSQSYGAAEVSVDIRTLAKELKVEFTNVTDVTGKTILLVTVKNKLNEIVPNTNFTFTLNGKDYNATTDANGQFIASGLTGDVSVDVKYNGTEYNVLDATSNFTFPKTESEEITPTNTTPTNTTPADDKKVTPVATKITAKKATFKAKKKSKKYTITLKVGKKAVSKVKVTIKVGKKTYTAKTNAKGKATFNLKKLTKKGKYTAVIKFKGNKLYKASSKKVKIVVK